MALSIRNPKTEAMARKVARATGVSITEAISRSLEETLSRIETNPAQDANFAAIMTISRRCAALPTLDTTAEDKLLGYSEDGVSPHGD